jgi:hypothetical protein
MMENNEQLLERIQQLITSVDKSKTTMEGQIKAVQDQMQ